MKGARPSFVVVLAGAAIVLLAFAARLWRLEFQSLWWDEGVSVYLTTVGLGGLTIAKDFSVDLHPPIYYSLLSLWRLLFGPSVFAFRLFSVFAGTLTIPIVFAFTRKLALLTRAGPNPGVPFGSPLPARGKGGVMRSDHEPWVPQAEPHTTGSSAYASPFPRAGRGDPKGTPGLGPALVAALLAAVSPIAVYYSQEIRMYPLLPALGGLSLLATLNVLERGKRRDWILWIVVSATSLYVYYYFGLLVAAEALALVVSLRRSQLVPWAIAQVAVLLALAPWLALMAIRMSGMSLAVPPGTEIHLDLSSYLALNGTDFTLGFTHPPDATILLALWVIPTLTGAILLGWRGPRLLALVVLAIAVPLLGAYVILLERPFFYSRFLLFAIVPLWSLAALGLVGYRRARPLGLLVLVALCAGSLWTWRVERITPRSGYAPDDYRTIFASIAPELRPGDLIAGGYPWQAGYVDAYLGRLGVRSAFLPGPIDASRLAALADPGARIWLYTYAPGGKFAPGEPQRLVAPGEGIGFLDQFGDTRATLFVRNPPTVAPVQPDLATLGDTIGLASATASPRQVVPGERIEVDLCWRALYPPANSYTVFVHLLGPNGKVEAQHDSPPLSGAAPTDRWSAGEVVVDRYWLTVPPDASAGRYKIEVGMYQPTNGKRLVQALV